MSYIKRSIDKHLKYPSQHLPVVVTGARQMNKITPSSKILYLCSMI